MEELRKLGDRIARTLLATSLPLLYSSDLFSQPKEDIYDPTSFMKGRMLISPQAQWALGERETSDQSYKPNGNAIETLLDMDFESGASGWQATGKWQVGTPTNGPESGFDSATAVGSNLNHRYLDSSDTSFLSPKISLPASETGTQLQLTFKEFYQLESYYDIGTIEVSNNDGKTWTAPISTRTGSTNNQWITSRYILDSFANQTIILRFRLTTDDTYSSAGWFIDNIKVEKVPSVSRHSKIEAVDVNQFPLVTLDYTAARSVHLCHNAKRRPRFEITENGVKQTPLSIESPKLNRQPPRLDLVFAYDQSGSMVEHLAKVNRNIKRLLNDLTRAGIDVAVGVTHFGKQLDGTTVRLHNNGQLTQNIDEMISWLHSNPLTNESYEPGYQAIKDSAEGFIFRQGSQRFIVSISDEFALQGETTVADVYHALDNAGVTLIAVTEPRLFGDFEPFLVQPNTQLFDINKDFRAITQILLKAPAPFYRLNYRSSNAIHLDEMRTISLISHCANQSDTAQGQYNPAAIPDIRLSADAESKNKTPQPNNQPLRIIAFINDTRAPFTHHARLYFRTGANPYQSVAMTQYSPTEFIADIPAEQVIAPALDYYIEATDGEHTRTLPTQTPQKSPFQVAVLPHKGPQITSVKVTPFSAVATIDKTVEVIDTVVLYYRLGGQHQYQAVSMQPNRNQQYQITLPFNDNTDEIFEYYIEARDKRGMTTRHGYSDSPIVITPAAKPTNKCDIDQNGSVDPQDTKLFIKRCKNSTVNIECDLNQDNKINRKDTALFRQSCNL